MDTLQTKIENRLKNLIVNKDQELGDLIYELGYEYENEVINSLMRTWTQNQKELVGQIVRLGFHGEFSIFWVRLNSENLLRTAQRTTINLINRQFPYNMIVFSNLEDNIWDFVNMKAVKDEESEEDKEPQKRQYLRRIRIDQQERLRTAVERISLLKVPEDGIHHFDLQKQHDEAFDVEKVTDAFFDEFKTVFAIFKNNLVNLTGDEKWAHDYGLQFFNRLIFIYFIQKKRWLGNDPEFIESFWQAYKESAQPKDSFVSKWLSVLFFDAFNKKAFYHKDWLPEKFDRIFKKAPYLNGGLFKRIEELDDKYNIQIQDKIFEKVFNFLQRYNFTITEDSPIEQEVAVDPEMIGKIFETMTFVEGDVDEAHVHGIVYTPRTEITLMCRLALVDRLTNEFGEDYKNWFYELLFALTEEDKVAADKRIAEINLWTDLYSFLQEITIVDPAVGSGSFLVGMLIILTDLIKRANFQLGNHDSDYNIKKQIIGNSLYGVEVMEWAVHVCELRLWLQLVVETEMKPEQLTLEPLLPNLNLKIRVGDSLVQEVGGINFSHFKLMELPAQLKGKLTRLKGEKRKFFFNEPDRKYKIERAIEQEELRLFREILDHQIHGRRERLKKIEKIINSSGTQITAFGEEKPVSGFAEKYAKEKAQLKQELSQYSEARSVLKGRVNIPFVWDVSFAEIFSEDKHGFDIVIGNPPYVRHELIAKPNDNQEDFGGENSVAWKAAKKSYKAKLMQSVYSAFPRFFHYDINEKKAKRKLDAKNDLYIYFYLHGLSLLNDKGSFCFVTSNSWLDVGYGRDLQEFLLKNVPIRMIIDNEVKRTFKSVDINTVICIFGSQKFSKAKFVMFKEPFEQVLNPVLFEEIEETEERKTLKEYRVVPKTVDELLESGLDPEKVKGHRIDAYTGNKWGGKYLRAPDIYYTILEKGKDKLVRLGDIAEVRFGIKTGANEFFYLTKEKIEEWGIEEEFLKPVIKNPRESNNTNLTKIELPHFVLMCDKPKTEIINKKVFNYIQFGEKKGHNLKPTCSARRLWYNLGRWEPTDAFWMESINDMNRVYINPGHLLESDKFYGITFSERKMAKTLAISLNSTIYSFYRELKGFHGMGQGVLKLPVYDVKDLDFILIESIFEFDNLSRPQESIYTECGFDKTKHIRSQEPNPLPDRKALDDIVFDAIGLTEDERKEVYWSVCELVQRRLEKARSV